jgi:hypothetical protein
MHFKNTIPKIKKNISRKGTAWLQSQFLNLCFCERFIYCIPLIVLPILLQENRWTKRGNKYINRSQTYECEN